MANDNLTHQSPLETRFFSASRRIIKASWAGHVCMSTYTHLMADVKVVVVERHNGGIFPVSQ